MQWWGMTFLIAHISFIYFSSFFCLWIGKDWEARDRPVRGREASLVVMTLGTDRSRMRQGKHGFRREPVGI